ncbi:unnamed protein product [Adineta steineri]|uniref:ADP ribosyltransferase domain-containing protein n=1 Tax=Adineta steineri TaxID=433720 RepID=A0A815FBS4_9BILA|nr:unnamed protein product [Adineta steineri]CAF1317049.1 unnamed protein product [Adineta steineri]CAF3945263.1 unnamed protein product [Adineta steineri]CAF4099360.1 unnamed protein product [Adineta steineri]
MSDSVTNQISNDSSIPSSRHYSSNNDLIDQYTLIWLDHSALDNSLDSLRTKTLFREVSDAPCLFSNSVESFLLKIQELRNQEIKILIIVSGSFAKEILPDTRNNFRIIIFCRNSNKYKRLKEHYPNIIDICTERETLETSIQRELPLLKFNLFSKEKLNSLRSLASSENATHNGAYFSYMLFIDFLKQIPSTYQAKDIMLNKCRDHFSQDGKQLERIEEFRGTYKQEEAIQWYTEESFLYHLVNRAFRTENIELWYLFRFYISDLCKQLEDVYQKQNCQTILTLYRGQSRLPTEELENFSSNKGGFLSTNAFFSTSKNIAVAKAYITDAPNTDDVKVVLFEITVDASNLRNTIFVDINEHLGFGPSNKFPGEEEVLFNIGSVFQIENINFDDNLNAWKIKMKATDECTDSIKERINSMKEKFKNGNNNLLFGRLLLDMNQHTKAESYFQMMLKILPKSHSDLPLVYDYIGDLNMHTTNWNEAFKNFHLSYEIKKTKTHPNHHQTIGITLNSLGNYYKAICDRCQALKYYSKVLNCKINPYNIAITLLNISTIHIIEKNYNKALDLCLQARNIIQENFSNTYSAVIRCHRIMGDIYFAQEDYDQAKDFYFAAFDLSKRALFTTDRQRIVCIKALTTFYYQQNMKQQAIEFCLKQLNFYEQHLTKNHINIVHLLLIIAELYEDNDKERIDYLEKALKILEENIHLHYDTTANCLKLIGQYYQKQQLNDKAMTFYKRTLEIQKKIYPKKHFTLKEIQYLIDMIDS